jgi:transposase
MLAEALWPEEMGLQVDMIDVVARKLIILAHGVQKTATCPDCQEASNRVHSQYQRHPADLPCVGYTVELQLTVPRFFCDNATCPRRTFAAQFPILLQSYARRTTRLREQQEQVGFAVSAETGSSLLGILGMLTSPDTLIRLVRQTPDTMVETPRVLGVDDWAQRKGQSYGTILVDLEKHEVVDLLPERSAESLSQWLQEHPGVEIISRDRGTEYIEGATAGAGNAKQIADRFHLFRNITDVVRKMLKKRAKKLRDAAHQVAQELQEEVNSQVETIDAEFVSEEILLTKGSEQSTLSEMRFAEVKALQAEGWSRRAVAKHLNMDRRTVADYFSSGTCPKRQPRRQSTSKAAPYMPYLARRWQEGCQNIAKLYDEVVSQGYVGNYMSVYRAVQKLLKEGMIIKAAAIVSIPVPNLSVTAATWLLVHTDDRLDVDQRRLRDKLCQISQEIKRAHLLVQSFCTLLREQKADQLDSWLDKAEQCGIDVFRNFAVGLRKDYAAVKAALTYEWSQGQVEGQINRLKLIKREMYGRANFDLLRKKVIGAPMLC